MKSFTISDAKANFSELIDELRISGDPIAICKHKREVAVIMAAEVFKKLQRLEDHVKLLQLREALKGKKRPLRKVLEELDLGI